MRGLSSFPTSLLERSPRERAHTTPVSARRSRRRHVRGGHGRRRRSPRSRAGSCRGRTASGPPSPARPAPSRWRASSCCCSIGYSRSLSIPATAASPPKRASAGSETAAAATDVVAVHRLGQDHVGVRVEPPDELVAVVVEVRPDRPATVTAERVLTLLRRPAEPGLELLAAPVGPVGEPSGRGETGGRRRPTVGQVGTAPVRGIVPDRLELQALQGELVGADGRADGQRRDAPHAVRVRDGPLQRPHAAHGATDDRRPGVDPEGVGEPPLGLHLVADRQEREPVPPGTAVAVRAGRPGGALTAAEDVGGDHEPAVGVDDAPGTDHAVPPPRRRVTRPRLARDVAVPGQRVQDQHRVRSVGSELTPGLVRDPDVGEGAAPFERHRPDRDEPPAPDGITVPPGAGRPRCRVRHEPVTRWRPWRRGSRPRGRP
jgi:hypothetical protein